MEVAGGTTTPFEPDRLLHGRDPWRRPGHHPAFPADVHHCLGAGLARLEAGVARRQRLTSDDVEVDDDQPAPRRRTFPFRAVDRLPVGITRAMS